MTGSSASHVRWQLVFCLFVLSAVAFLDRVNISIAGTSIARDYHLTDIQLGWVFSSFLAGYALFQTLGGRLADRFGPRRVLAGGVVWWGVFTALTTAVPQGIKGALLLFVSIRFLFGAGEAVVYPASNQFVSALDSHRGTRNRQWLDLCRSGRRRRPLPASNQLHHVPLWLESVVLGLRGNRVGCGPGVVHRRTGQAGRARARFGL